ncbi:MAG: heme biosynthesis protein HemY [Rhodocyclaceae bacterium]|nr:heme biosynthesis protein HemY [Rhodocyclaceae bacterium]
MRTLFWLLALFALAVGVSLAFGDNNGYVLIALPPWRAELSLNFFVVILALGFVLSYFLLRFLFHTLRLPQAVRAYRARKRREKALSALQDAMLQLYEGRYGHALKSAARTYAAGEAQALSALLAARAAHFLRDEQREREWLERAAEHDAEALAARLMTEAELHLEARRFEAALASLNAMQEKGRRQIAALRLALRAHRELGHWEDVLRVTRQLEKAHGLTPEGAAPLKLRAHQEALRARAGDAPALAAYWQAVPARERYVPQLAATAARGSYCGRRRSAGAASHRVATGRGMGFGTGGTVCRLPGRRHGGAHRPCREMAGETAAGCTAAAGARAAVPYAAVVGQGAELFRGVAGGQAEPGCLRGTGLAIHPVGPPRGGQPGLPQRRRTLHQAQSLGLRKSV